MNLRQRIGQLLIIGDIIGGIDTTEHAAAIRTAIAQGEVGGVYLGYPHFRDPKHAGTTIAGIQKLAPHKLFVAVDFENGPGYNCMNHCAHLPYLMGLGHLDDEVLTRKVGRAVAQEALAMGCNWLFGPCVDVNLEPDNPIVGLRSFGEHAELVSRMGRAFIQGVREVGVLCTAKHFPGTGNAAEDSHNEIAHDRGDMQTWTGQTRPPFDAAIAAGCDAIMTAHIAMPFLDASGQAATFSHAIMTDLLRDRMGFNGIVVTDSLGMGGAMGKLSVAQRCLLAFEAGCDALLTPWESDIIDVFIAALEQGRISEDRLNASVNRMVAARERLASLVTNLQMPDHQSLCLNVGRRVATVQRGKEHLPVKPGEFAVVTQWRLDEAQYFPREPGVLSRWQHELRLHDATAPVAAITRACETHEHEKVIPQVGDRPVVVLGAIVKHYARDPYAARLSDGTLQLIRTLAGQGKTIVLCVLGSPYVARHVPEAQTVICGYGDSLGCALGTIERLTETH